MGGGVVQKEELEGFVKMKGINFRGFVDRRRNVGGGYGEEGVRCIPRESASAAGGGEVSGGNGKVLCGSCLHARVLFAFEHGRKL